MITAMRNNSKSLKIVLWIVIVAFASTIVVVWGYGNKQTTMSFVAKVGDYTISIGEYQEFRRRMQGSYRNTELSPQAIESAILEEAIKQRLFLLEAERLAIPVSNEEVLGEITNDQFFFENGRFDIARYQEFVPNPRSYEESVRTDLRLRKLINIVTSALSVTEEEINKEYAFLNTTLDASYFTVDSNSYRDESTPADIDLAAFYTTNQESYRVPASIKLKYLSFREADFDYTPTLTENDLNQYYTANIMSFITPKTAGFSYIMFPVADWNNEEEAANAATLSEAAHKDLSEGKSFMEVAVKYSQSGVVDAVEDIPYYGNGNEMEEAIFNLKAGEYSVVLATNFGYHIFRADKVTESRVAAFDEVKYEIEMVMVAENRQTAWRNHLYGIYREIAATGNITAYLASHPGKYEIYETDFISETDSNDLLTDESREILFNLTKTEMSEIVDINSESYLFEISDRINSFIPPIDDIKAQLTSDYRSWKAFENCMQDVNSKVSAETMTAEEFSSLSSSFNARLSFWSHLRRSEAVNPILSNDFTNGLFEYNENGIAKYASSLTGQVFVVRITKVQLPDISEIDDMERQALVSFLTSIKQADAVDGFVSDLKKRYTVVINPQYSML